MLKILYPVLQVVAVCITIVSIVIATIQIIISLRINAKWDSSVSSKVPLPRLFFLHSSFWSLTKLKKLVMSHLYYLEDKFDAGTYDHVYLQFYVDLMEAAVSPKELKIMTVNLVRLIKDNIDYDFSIIAVPKNGCPLLAYEVAKYMKKKLLIVKDYGPRHSYQFDGRFVKGETAIIIDDVSSDGSFLKNPIAVLKKNKIASRDCLVLIHRKEGNAKRKLKSAQHTLHYILELSDGDIANMLGVSLI